MHVSKHVTYVCCMYVPMVRYLQRAESERSRGGLRNLRTTYDEMNEDLMRL